jgi:phage anti-repressor protein
VQPQSKEKLTKEIQVLDRAKPESVFAGSPGERFPVDARMLWKWLEVGTVRFDKWISNRIEEYGFVEMTDYCPLKRTTVNYMISISMAKELAMVERNDKGREIRKYFISCEEKLKQVSTQTKNWSIAREEGKLARRVETDIIKSFIEYAKGQGSQSADMYFINFSKMVNASLLEFEGKAPAKLRDSLNPIQLHAISVAETIIARTLVECMTSRRPYKEIYPIVKEKISEYGRIVGKSRPGISAREYVGLIA